MARRGFIIKNLAEVAAARAALPEHFKPTKQPNGRWHMPKWSSLRIARERRRLLEAGEPWKWEVPAKKVDFAVPFKGHKRYLERIERKQKVARCMERMPQMVAEHREAARLARRERTRERIGLYNVKGPGNEPRSRFDDIKTKPTEKRAKSKSG